MLRTYILHPSIKKLPIVVERDAYDGCTSPHRASSPPSSIAVLFLISHSPSKVRSLSRIRTPPPSAVDAGVAGIALVTLPNKPQRHRAQDSSCLTEQDKLDAHYSPYIDTSVFQLRGLDRMEILFGHYIQSHHRMPCCSRCKLLRP